MDWTPDDVLTTDKYMTLASPSVAYIKTDTLVLGRPIRWRGSLHAPRAAPLWITGHSDYPITPALVARQAPGSWQRWAAINKDVSNANIIALPLGITNNCADSPIHPIFGNPHIMWDVAQTPRIPVGLAYANFAVDTFPSVRKPLMDWLQSLPWVTIGHNNPTLEGRRRYLTEIRAHKFTFCPRGNGIDTHRLWETLYVGGIPIVERALALEEFADLPICWVERFSTVTPEFLEEEYTRITLATTSWNWEKLKFSYWRRRIQELESAALADAPS